MDAHGPYDSGQTLHQQQQQPKSILTSTSNPSPNEYPGPATMDRGMGTRQSVVTFVDTPSIIDRSHSVAGGGVIPPLLAPRDHGAVHPGLHAPSQDHLQNLAPPVPGLNRPTSMLSAASASSALSELSESLRWAQKFPEGKHLSRARNSVISLAPPKDKSALGNASEVEIVPTLGYASGRGGGSGGSTVADSGRGSGTNLRASRSRLSALSLHGLLKAPRAWRSEEENQTLNETRSGLRFLAKRREEVEEEDYNVHATFVGPTQGLQHHPQQQSLSGHPDMAMHHQHNGRKIDRDGDDDAWEDEMGGPRRYVGSLPSVPDSTASMPHLDPAVVAEPPPRKARWNLFKWFLFLSTIIIFMYGTGALVAALLTWSRSWGHADVTVVADTDILIFITLASFLCVLTSVVGLCGAILNNRPILALYAFLLWPTFMSMMVVGYSSYKRANLRLDRKLNMAWSRYYTDLDRLRLQNNLHCCGFYSPLHEATFSRTCYPRTTLPGCKGKLFRYERTALRTIYRITFTLIFVHLGAIAASLLCSNHVNEQFGKGLTPRAYRLDMGHVRRNAVNIMRALVESGVGEEQEKARAEAMAPRELVDEKHGWDAGEETPVGSAHGHGHGADAMKADVLGSMGYAGDLGYGPAPHEQHRGQINQNFNFPPRHQDAPAVVAMHIDPAPIPEAPSPTTVDLGAGGIRVVSYRGGHPPGMEADTSAAAAAAAGGGGNVPVQHGTWAATVPGARPEVSGHMGSGGGGTVRGLGFTMAMPADAAASLRDRRLGELA